MRAAVYGILTVLCLAAPVAAKAPIVGVVGVVDADTLDVGGTRIRLQGIDAVERHQTCRTEHGVTYPCGRVATDWARARWEGAWAVCTNEGPGGYGRVAGTCRIGGEDVAATLVIEGFAQAYPRYSRAYTAHQAAAEARDAGLWAGAHQSPASFRVYGTGGPAPDPACAIKGNVSDSGRIYHAPGSRYYDRTRIDTGRGERWFCSIAEAEIAGWRAPRG